MAEAVTPRPGPPDDVLEVWTGWARVVLHLSGLAVTAPLALGALSAWAREGGARLLLVALLFSLLPLVSLAALSGVRRPVLRLERDGLRLRPRPFSDLRVAWEDIAGVRLERRAAGRRLATYLVLELRDEAALRRCHPREPRWAAALRRRSGGPPTIPVEVGGLDRPPAAVAEAVARRIGRGPADPAGPSTPATIILVVLGFLLPGLF